MTFKIPHRNELEVYVNEGGEISIRQEKQMDNDAIVSIPRDQVDTVISFLKKAAEQIDSGAFNGDDEADEGAAEEENA